MNNQGYGAKMVLLERGQKAPNERDPKKNSATRRPSGG